VTRTPFGLVQLRDEFVADAEGFNVPEGNTRRPIRRGCEGPPESTGRGIRGKRSTGELGKPQRAPDMGTAEVR
jgi:hypothetical protein